MVGLAAIYLVVGVAAIYLIAIAFYSIYLHALYVLLYANKTYNGAGAVCSTASTGSMGMAGLDVGVRVHLHLDANNTPTRRHSQ